MSEFIPKSMQVVESVEKFRILPSQIKDNASRKGCEWNQTDHENRERTLLKSHVARDDFLNNNILSNLKVNPKQHIAAFMIHKANLPQNRYDVELWIMYLDSGHVKKMNIREPIKDFTWKDNSLIYFSIHEETSIFFTHDIVQNKGEEWLTIPMKISEFTLTRDALFFCSRTTDVEKTNNVLEGTETPFFKESEGIYTNFRNSLYAYRFANKKLKKMTDEQSHINLVAFSETGNHIVFTRSAGDKHETSKADIFVMNVESEILEKVSSDIPLSISDIGFFDEQTVVFAGSDLKTYGRNENHEFYIVDIHTKQQRKILNAFDKSNKGIAVATDARFNQSNRFHIRNNHVFFLTVEGSSTCLYQMNKNGMIDTLSSESGTIDSFDIIEDGILFVGLRGQLLQEIYTLKKGKEEKLTGFNDWLSRDRTVSKPESLNYVNAEGICIDGWVIRPIDYSQFTKYPGILFIHGGPKMVYSDVYYHLMQLLAAHGYFVFFCNPRGSDGKGNQFADIRGNFATYAFADIICFTDKVLERFDNLDENRLGVIGGSYGGYLTNYMIGQTSRFKAAVSEKSFCNLVSSFNTSDIGYGYTSCYLGEITPWNGMKAYIANSPLTYAEQVKTPTLFIHGKNDYRCHYSESLQMYHAISYFGTKAKLCLFEDENHFFESKGKPLTKIKRFNEIITWFDTHLGG